MGNLYYLQKICTVIACQNLKKKKQKWEQLNKSKMQCEMKLNEMEWKFFLIFFATQIYLLQIKLSTSIMEFHVLNEQ